MRRTLKQILVEYGAVAVVVYLVIFFAVFFGFWAAIRFGWHPSGALANMGAVTAAYLATKVTQPLRIIGTLALTPLVARGVERFTGRKRSVPPAADSTASPRDVA
ncbi:MAG TPA: hypothetical protein VJ867_06100 [Gemmatimonadaceae bacterium]|nr:hypothetical protein [Gemmatimonadaceae bacterium]